MSTFSNLTDTPRVDKDQLGIDKYKKGLKMQKITQTIQILVS